MDLDNRLYRLGSAIQDAQDAIDAAIREAEAIDCDVPDEAPDPHWPALSSLIGSLAAIKAVLSGLPGAEMAKAIDDADANLDHLGDLADGLSY